MRNVIYLAIMFSAIVTYAECDPLIFALKSRNLELVKNELSHSCDGKFKTEDEFGDVKEEELGIYLKELVKIYPKCSESYKNKQYTALDKCLTDSNIESICLYLDKTLKLDLMVDIESWKKFLKLESEVIAKNESNEAAKRLEEKRANDIIKIKNEHNRKSKGIDIYENACAAKDSINYFKNKIEKENAVGKISGVVDKAILHDAGKRIIIFTDLLSGYDQEHRRRFSKPLDMEKCKCSNGALGIDCK